MKNYKSLSTLLIIILSLVNACRNSDTTDSSTISGNGNITLKFENGFGNLGDIVLNTTTQTSSNSQKHQFSTLQYIISNIVLIKEDGTEIKYNYNNPDKGAFIIDQADATGGINSVTLNQIPAANYTKIKIGLGISKEAFLLGQSGQADFWSKAQAKGLTWSWAAGYIDVKLEGKYGANLERNFVHHLGKKMSVDTNPEVYREITISMPTSAKVRTNITPAIHFMVDFNHYLSGNTPILLDPNNEMNMSGTGIAQTIIDNLTKAFTIAHVHND